MKKSVLNPPRSEMPSDDEVSLRKGLEMAGCRFTRQRLAIYRYLQAVHTHPTAEEVYAAVRRDLPNISLATVYKSLEALVACRLAGKLDYAGGPARYDCRSDNHYHIRCLKTGKVRDLDIPFDPDLVQRLDGHIKESLEREGFRITDYRLELLGHFSS